jgi:hypothetical protein
VKKESRKRDEQAMFEDTEMNYRNATGFLLGVNAAIDKNAAQILEENTAHTFERNTECRQ